MAKSLVEYFEGKKKKGEIIRLWTKENAEGQCEFLFIKEILTNPDGGLYGIMCVEDFEEYDDGELIKAEDIYSFTCLEIDQEGDEDYWSNDKNELNEIEE